MLAACRLCKPPSHITCRCIPRLPTRTDTPPPPRSCLHTDKSCSESDGQFRKQKQTNTHPPGLRERAFAKHSSPHATDTSFYGSLPALPQVNSLCVVCTERSAGNGSWLHLGTLQSVLCALFPGPVSCCGLCMTVWYRHLAALVQRLCVPAPGDGVTSEQASLKPCHDLVKLPWLWLETDSGISHWAE